MNGISALSWVALGACVLLGSALPASAGLKSGKISTTLTNPANNAGAFVNGVSKGTFSFKGTKATIKAKGTTVPDTDGVHCSGDEVICLVSVDVTVNGGSSMDVVVVLAAEAKGGKVTASHDLCKDRDESVVVENYFFCPESFGSLSPLAVSSVTASCFASEPAWVSANSPSLPMSLTGHSCEGVLTPAPTNPSDLLFTSGSTLVVQ
ncbi:MAG TPA: hypothetical protein VEB21_06400 [Terriglobales bacterium]|nr:hypothetical protein [Terriglobales bacterium]